MNWDGIVKLDEKNTNSSFSNFHNGITYLLDEFAPLYKVTKKEYKLKFKPWINPEILDLIKERDKLFKSHIKEKDELKKLTS